MKVLKSKVIGIFMVLFAISSGIHYTLCIFTNGTTNEGLVFFRDDTFFGIPLFNEYWTLALPIYLIVLFFLILIGWLGIAAITTGEPKVSEEEMRKIRILDENFRKKKEGK
ncbi:MAG: hypothetical protein ACTSQJ_00090 [Promethearchaeota archaeon]